MRNIYFVNQYCNDAVLQKQDERHFPFPPKALFDRRLTGSAVKLLAALYFYCAVPKWTTIHSAKEISKPAGLSERTTIDSLDLLAKTGYLFCLVDKYGVGFAFPKKKSDMVSIERTGWPTLFCAGIRGTSCLVFLAISIRVDDTGSVQISHEQIHEVTGVSCANVALIVKQLEALGVLRIEHTKLNNSIRGVNRYFILNPTN